MFVKLKFKTNINCGSCIAAVTPALNQVAGEGKWSVDTENPAKILTVDADASAQTDIFNAVKSKGYQIEPLSMS